MFSGKFAHGGEQHAGQMILRAGTAGSHFDLRLRFAPCDEVGHGAQGQRRRDHQQVRRDGESRNEFVIVEDGSRIPAIDERRDGERGGGGADQRMPVGHRRAAGFHAVGGAGTGTAVDAVVDDDVLAECGAELCGDDARQHIDAAARHVGNNDADRPRRVFVGAGAGSGEHQHAAPKTAFHKSLAFNRDVRGDSGASVRFGQACATRLNRRGAFASIECGILGRLRVRAAITQQPHNNRFQMRQLLPQVFP